MGFIFDGCHSEVWLGTGFAPGRAHRAPLKSIGSGDVSMAIDPLPPIGGTR